MGNSRQTGIRLRSAAPGHQKTVALETHQELERQLEDLRRLHDVSRRLAGFTSLEATLQEVLAQALAVYHADMGILSLLLPDGRGLRVGASIGFSKDFLKRVDALPAGTGTRALCLSTGQPQIVEDMETDPRVQEHLDMARDGGFRAVHSIPLINRAGKPIGVLSAHFHTPRRPADREVKFAELYARLAADSIEQAELRMKAEQELRQRKLSEEAAQKFAAIVNSSNDAIISKDLNSRIMSWNKGAERIFGYKAEEVLGQSITLLIPENLISEESVILDRIRRGETLNHYETIRRRKDGTLIDISLTVSPIIDGEGKIIGASKIARDITGVKDTEEKLRQAQKMEAVGRLAGGIAHDFNNLLTSINGFAELAEGGVQPGSSVAEYLSEIRKSGERAANLTQQLLAYSRKQILAPRIIDLNATVKEMDKMLARLIGEDINIQCVLEPELGTMRADPNQVQQIIVNLALNARDAMPNGGDLVIKTAGIDLDAESAAALADAKPGRHIMLEVGDTGVGMTAEVQARIFEPFFTTKEVGQGTGLGLSSVYGIVKQSGGSISVSSLPGKGTAFRIYFPRSEEPGSKPAVPAVRFAGPGAMHGETVLLVEDEAAVRKFLATILQGHGYAVIEAENGVKALEAGRQAPHLDLLLTDVLMPGMNGGKLAEHLMAQHANLKVLFISGYTKEILNPKGSMSTDKNFLQKPFTQAELLTKLRETISRAPDR